MTNKPHTTIWTARDHQIAGALLRSPMTAGQLLACSQTFTEPFASNRVIRRRLQRLCDGGWVRCWQYASTSPGVHNYYKLTIAGYRMLNGPTVSLPGRSFFRPVSPALQQHTQRLADFIVATTIAVYQSHYRISDFYAENSLRISFGGQQVKPDCAFTVIDAHNQSFNYLVELDNGTEPVCSTKERDSLSRKVRFYDRYQDAVDHRFRVLMFFSEASSRLFHFLQIARGLVRNKQRRLFFAVALSPYLMSLDPLHLPLFRDHNGKPTAMIPSMSHAVPASTGSKCLDQVLPTW